MVARESIEPWFLLVNPAAAGGRALLDYPQISKLLHDEDICCEPHFTDHKFHAVELTVSAIKRGYRKIIILGGDGTLHEVVNGLFIQQEVDPAEVLLGMIGVGEGCNWLRNFGFVEGRYIDMVRAIKAELVIRQDVGRVTYEESLYRQSRYMVGTGATGFNAHIVRRFAHRNKRHKEYRWSRIWCIVKSFFRYKSTGVKIYVDDQLIYNDLLFSAAIGIGRFSGGGLQQLPEAVVDDGLFDVTLIRPFYIWHIFFRLRYLFNGNIYRIGHTEQWRGERIRIESTPELSVEIDGELYGETPLEFEILPQVISVVVSRYYIESRAVEIEQAARRVSENNSCESYEGEFGDEFYDDDED